MPGDAARLEAIGEPAVSFEFRGRTITIARAVEDWPLDMVRAAVAQPMLGRPFLVAVLALLDRQDAGPLVCMDDYVELSHRMADAVGVSPLPETPVEPTDVFGAVPVLLDLLDNNAEDVASDLKRFWSVDYLDRWRGNLTLREIWSYIRRLPTGSVTARARNGGKEVWTLSDQVNAAVWEFLAHERYPGRPATEAEIEAWAEAARRNEAKVDKLRDRQQRYSSPAEAAAATARENRLKELARNGENGRTT